MDLSGFGTGRNAQLCRSMHADHAELGIAIGFFTGSCGRYYLQVRCEGECGVSAPHKITKTLVLVFMTLKISRAFELASAKGSA